MNKLSMVDDTRIEDIQKILTPAELIKNIPLDEQGAEFVSISRESASNIIHLKDPRLLFITGPCSIHNVEEALEYGEKLVELQKKCPYLLIIKRAYGEKIRSKMIKSWLGIINDPDLNNSCDIEKGLKIYRKLLIDLCKMRIPVGIEFLDMITPQFNADAVSWGAIGARTTESQEHRKLASGLSMPIGFKNATSGDITAAINAILSAQGKNTFLSTTKNGHVAKVTTKGNPDGHIIHRGGKIEKQDITNYDKNSIKQTIDILEQENINTGIIVDFSHGNSFKKAENQMVVCKDIAEQIAAGNKKICGCMNESTINGGSYPFVPGVTKLSKIPDHTSLTDAGVPWSVTEEMAMILNEAVEKRMKIK